MSGNISNCVHYLVGTKKNSSKEKYAFKGPYNNYFRVTHKPIAHRTASALARKLTRYWAVSSERMIAGPGKNDAFIKDAGDGLVVVTVDLTTGERHVRTADEFIRYVAEYRARPKSGTKKLSAPVRPLIDSLGKPCTLGDDVVMAGYTGHPYRGTISGFTPYNVQVLVPAAPDSKWGPYHKYVSYRRFRHAVIKLS